MSLERGIREPLPSSFSTIEMVSLTQSMMLYISKSIRQFQVCSPWFLHYTPWIQKSLLDAYAQAGITQFQCMFLYVTKR